MTATIASDDPGFFNYTDYEFSALRNIRFGVSAELRASQRFQVLGEVRLDHGDVFEPYALYVRIRPWADRRFDIQVGRVPPTFGAYGRGAYGSGNLLIGTPLAYQYLTSLRPDALPATNDDLLRMRGRGWLSNFPVGNTAADRGLPIVNSHPLGHRRAGARRHRHGRVDRIGHDRLAVQSARRRQQRRPTGRRPRGGPSDGGAGVGRFGFARRVAEQQRSKPCCRRAAQSTTACSRRFGVDAEYSQGRFLGASEVIWSRWTLPIAAMRRGRHAAARDVGADRRPLRILPGLHLAARGERLDFSRAVDAGRPADVGSASHAVRNRRRLFDDAQRHGQGIVAAQPARRRPRPPRHARRAQVVYWF